MKIYQELSQKKAQLDSLRPLPKRLVQNLEQWFKIELTYTSNAIEGNTLTRRETAIIIEKGLTVGGKGLKEHLEATNHGEAIDFISTLSHFTPRDIKERDLLQIHKIILSKIDDEYAGLYRNIPVRIAGSRVIMPNPVKISSLMKNFFSWLHERNDLHPVQFATEAHYRLVTIHPFIDGNGRTARLLMNLLLTQAGYPPAIIRKKDRLDYLKSLETAQLGGPVDSFHQLIAHACKRSLDIYLTSLQGKNGQDDNLDEEGQLLKIGQLSAQIGESIPTLRHWIKEELLIAEKKTSSGYQLFSLDAVKRCKKIQKLKSERLTLKEIKEKLRWS